MFRVGAFGELKEIRGGSRELRDIMSDPDATCLKKKEGAQSGIFLISK